MKRRQPIEGIGDQQPPVRQRGRSLSSGLAGALVALIRVYQYVSRMTPRRCRFHPTCSQYALEAIRGHGPWRGTGLALARLGRCHPWNPGGYDPVPEAGSGETENHEPSGPAPSRDARRTT